MIPRLFDTNKQLIGIDVSNAASTPHNTIPCTWESWEHSNTCCCSTIKRGRADCRSYAAQVQLSSSRRAPGVIFAATNSSSNWNRSSREGSKTKAASSRAPSRSVERRVVEWMEQLSKPRRCCLTHLEANDLIHTAVCLHDVAFTRYTSYNTGTLLIVRAERIQIHRSP